MTARTHSPGSSLYCASETDEPRERSPLGPPNHSFGVHGSKPFHGGMHLETMALVSPDQIRPDTPRILERQSGSESDHIPCEPQNWDSLAVNFKRKREEETDELDLAARQVLLHNTDRKFTTAGSIDARSVTSHTGFSECETTAPDTKRTRLNGFKPGNFWRNRDDIKGRTEFIRVAQLPLDIWQHIFCFVPPVSLGRLLRVSHAFNALLTPGTSLEPYLQTPSGEDLGSLDAEAIWASSRKRFCPGLPRPLRWLQELSMWRLLRGNDCQICGQRRTLLTSNSAAIPWQSGPGENGVRIIWPFGVRCCGNCLRIHSEKEVTLLFSSTFPSFLLPGLPFAFVSDLGNYVASTAVRNIAQPVNVKLIKHYYKPQIEDIKRQFEIIRDLGDASAEEWTKGLETEGKDRCNEATRWEQWEAKGGLKKVNMRPMRPHIAVVKPTSSSNSIGPATSIHFTDSDLQDRTTLNPAPPTPSQSAYPQRPSGASTARLHPTNPPGHGSLPQRPQVIVPQIRPERSIKDVNESKAARRAEIERRCMNLNPPLDPAILCHMDSYQAALQISTELTEAAWDVLKPRLLAQRESAEQRENERIRQSRILRAKSDERRQQDAQTKDAKEVHDKEWDAAQAPIRDGLASYADELIKRDWAGGNRVTKDTCSKFAAEVLLYTRRRFYEDQAMELNTAPTAGQNVESGSPDTPPTRKLILENMKWLFDNKIKNFTEHFQKELFLCNGCDGNFKFYGFEGVIQHYAAKHTTTLSHGSIVVHWRAEWPEHPPFHPNPSAAKAAWYAVPQPMPAALSSQYTRPSNSAAIYSEYGQPLMPVSQTGVQGFAAQFSPGPPHAQYHSNFQHGLSHQPRTPLHYSHQPEYQPQSSVYQPASPYFAASPLNGPIVVNGFQSYSENTNVTQRHPIPMNGPFPQSNQHLVYPNSASLYPSNEYSHTRPPPPTSMQSSTGYMESAPALSVSAPDLYKIQLNEMARHARDVWTGTSGIKDIPQSVRIYVIIHRVLHCFKQKYTNEPSLAMFLDGLDNIALMRPIRSLNGLACKTCVTSGYSQNTGYHAHSAHLPTDRRLYTLPHLLNHFRHDHLERGVNLQNGPEALRVDWKRDMIELPDTPLIEALVHASGMDDAKLQLISWVFPGIFPSSLPNIGGLKSSWPVPKHRGDYNDAVIQHHQRHTLPTSDVYHKAGQVPVEAEIATTRSFPDFRALSPSSTQTPEPPGEDEYDPNRPQFYGKLVQSHQTIAHVRKTGNSLPLTRQYHQVQGTEETFDRNRKYAESLHPLASSHAQSRSKFNSGSPQKHHEKQKNPIAKQDHCTSKAEEAGRSSRKPEVSCIDPATAGKHRFVSEDGELVDEAHANGSNQPSPSSRADITAAERFLNDFSPALVVNGHDHQQDNDSRSYPLRQGVLEPSSKSRSLHIDQSSNLSRRTDETVHEQSLRSTPSQSDCLDVRNGKLVSKANGHTGYDNDHGSITQVRYSYLDDASPINRQSSPVFDTRSVSHTGRHPEDAIERIVEVPRSVHEAGRRHPNIRHRSRSMSPRPVTREIEHYHIREGQEPLRREPIYHVSNSPVDVVENAQRLVHYAYPPVQEEDDRYVARRHPEDQYRPHIEYIPVRSEDYNLQEPTRYIITQPTEQRRPVDRVRIERTYAGEQIIRDGRLYYAEPRQVGTRPVRTVSPGYVEYPSNFR